MGFRYKPRTSEEIAAIGDKLAKINQMLYTTLQKMEQHGMKEVFLAFSERSLGAINDMRTAMALSESMVESQVDAKSKNLPNPYEGNADRAADERDRKAAASKPIKKVAKKKGTP